MANLSHLPKEWRESGLTQTEFCKRQGLKLATFSYWRSKELRALDQSKHSTRPPVSGSGASLIKVSPAFSEVVVKDAVSANAIEISLPNGTLIRIPLSAC